MLQLLDDRRKNRTEERTSPSRAAARLATHPIVCASCEHRITTREAAIAVDGTHEHVRSNPAGVLFAFRCFKEAEGCQHAGAPTLEATWFPGQPWIYAFCGGCGGHLGWRWEGARPFYGLVADRIVDGSEGG